MDLFLENKKNLYLNGFKMLGALFCVSLLPYTAEAQLDREYEIGPDCADCVELFDDLTFQLIVLPAEVTALIDLYRPLIENHFPPGSDPVQALEFVQSRVLIESLSWPLENLNYENQLEEEQTNGVTRDVIALESFSVNPGNVYFLPNWEDYRDSSLYKGYRLLGHLDNAIGYAEGLVKKTNLSLFYIPLGDVYFARANEGDLERSLSAYKSALALLEDSETKEAVEQVINLRLGIVYLALNNIDEALTHIRSSTTTEIFSTFAYEKKAQDILKVIEHLRMALSIEDVHELNEEETKLINALIDYRATLIQITALERCFLECSDWMHSSFYSLLEEIHLLPIDAQSQTMFIDYAERLVRFSNQANEETELSSEIIKQTVNLALARYWALGEFEQKGKQLEALMLMSLDNPSAKRFASVAHGHLADLYYNEGKLLEANFHSIQALNALDTLDRNLEIVSKAEIYFGLIAINYEMEKEFDKAFIFGVAQEYVVLEKLNNINELPPYLATHLLGKEYTAYSYYYDYLDRNWPELISRGRKLLDSIAVSPADYRSNMGGSKVELFFDIMLENIWDLRDQKGLVDPFMHHHPAEFYSIEEMRRLALVIAVAYYNLNDFDSAIEYLELSNDYAGGIEYQRDRWQITTYLYEVTRDTSLLRDVINYFSMEEIAQLDCRGLHSITVAASFIEQDVTTELKNEDESLKSTYLTALRNLKSVAENTSILEDCLTQTPTAILMYGYLLLKENDHENLILAGDYVNDGFEKHIQDLSFNSWDAEEYFALTNEKSAFAAIYLEACNIIEKEKPNAQLFQIIERCRDNRLLAADFLTSHRSIYDLLIGNAKVNSDEVSDEYISTTRELNRKIVEAEAEISSIDIEEDFAAYREALKNKLSYQTILLELSEYSETDVATNIADFDTAQTQSLLQDREAIFLIQDATNVTLALLITQDEIVSKTINLSTERTQELISSLRNSLDLSNFSEGSELQSFDVEAAYSLYSSTLGLFSSHLENINHISFVSAGPMQSIPLSILLTDPVEDNERLQNYPWAYKKFTFSRLPSLRSLNILRMEQSSSIARNSFLGVGDPALGSAGTSLRGLTVLEQQGVNISPSTVTNLASLPETRREIEELANYFNAPTTDLLFGSEASEKDLKAIDLKSYSTLAFATHGLLSGELPGLSEPALVLTPPENYSSSFDDGLLTASEIENLDLNAELVILSACNTYFNLDIDTGGLSSISGAFLTAGARNLLVTHWAVESEIASFITRTTIDRFQIQPEEGLAGALRYAMGQAQENPDWQHPAFWAPFSVVGNNYSRANFTN
jgi:CHAT domain-containing protein